MNAPHCRGSWRHAGNTLEYERCRYCQVPIRDVGWSLCSSAPKVDSIPVVGEVWEIVEGDRILRTTITAVTNLGDWWWGHKAVGQSFYSGSTCKWPPERAVRVEATPSERMTRSRLLNEG